MMGTLQLQDIQEGLVVTFKQDLKDEREPPGTGPGKNLQAKARGGAGGTAEGLEAGRAEAQSGSRTAWILVARDGGSTFCRVLRTLTDQAPLMA